MRQWLAWICVLALLALPCALAEEADEEAAEETYAFLVQISGEEGEEPIDVAITMDADAAPMVELLGEPMGYFESESCAFQGLDKAYTYLSFVLNTYPQDGLDLVSSLYLMDDTVTTAEGAYIGMHVDEINALYGEPTRTADTSITYEKGGCALSFMLDADGYVNAITYVSLAACVQ